MGHHHHHHGHHHHHHHGDGTSGLSSAFFINLIFAFIELAGGLYTNSVAIISDSVHDFGDSFSLGLSWFFEKISKKKRSSTFSFGYKRFSLLAALINANILVISSIFVITEAVKRISNPEEVKTTEMLYMAILGIVFNTIAFLRLNHGHSTNEKVIRLHFVEDILGWIAVLIVSIIFQFKYIPALDSLVSIAIAAFILYNAALHMKSTLKIFLQAVPEDHNIEELKESVKSVPGVLAVHDVHVWSLSESYIVMTAHVVVDQNHDIKELSRKKEEIKHMLHHKGIQHATIEFEAHSERCMQEDC